MAVSMEVQVARNAERAAVEAWNAVLRPRYGFGVYDVVCYLPPGDEAPFLTPILRYDALAGRFEIEASSEPWRRWVPPEDLERDASVAYRRHADRIRQRIAGLEARLSLVEEHIRALTAPRESRGPQLRPEVGDVHMPPGIPEEALRVVALDILRDGLWVQGGADPLPRYMDMDTWVVDLGSGYTRPGEPPTSEVTPPPSAFRGNPQYDPQVGDLRICEFHGAVWEVISRDDDDVTVKWRHKKGKRTREHVDWWSDEDDENEPIIYKRPTSVPPRVAADEWVNLEPYRDNGNESDTDPTDGGTP